MRTGEDDKSPKVKISDKCNDADVDQDEDDEEEGDGDDHQH